VVEFRGKYEHSIDDRGRVSLPARYRNELTGKIILTMSVDGCIEVYTQEGFDEVASHVAVDPPTTPEGRRARRAFYSESFDTELDRQGRILIPPPLRQSAAVDGTVVIAGRKECLEIWNPRRLTEVSGGAGTAPSTEQAPEV
jgi:transcriptional regulator MraZ